MGIFDIFTGSKEKEYRRAELHEKFCKAAYDYLSEEESFESFVNGKACFIYHSDSPRSYGMGGRTILARYNQVIDLSKLDEFLKVKKNYQELKNRNISWLELFSKLNDQIFDLLVEAVSEFEKKYSLPKQW
jgi:hypothetical protein